METRSILVVVRDEGLGFLLDLILAEAGLRAVFVESGPEALAHIEESKPALVIVDVKTPQNGALEAIAQLKASPIAGGVPVWALTYAETAADEAAEAGADRRIRKPFDIDWFVAAVKCQVLGETP